MPAGQAANAPETHHAGMPEVTKAAGTQEASKAPARSDSTIPATVGEMRMVVMAAATRAPTRGFFMATSPPS